MDINKLATSIWKLRSWLNTSNIEKKTQPDKALKVLESILIEENVEVFDYTGKEFDAGLAVEVLDNISTNKEDTNYIVQTLKPIITINGKVSQLGQVVLGNDITNLDYIDDLKQVVNETRKKKSKLNVILLGGSIVMALLLGLLSIYQLTQINDYKDKVSNPINDISDIEEQNSTLVSEINELEDQIKTIEQNNDSTKPEFLIHKVIKGETLISILKKYNLDYRNYIETVKMLNNISNINVIKEGSVIVLPGGGK